MPDIYQMSVDIVVKECIELEKLGIKAVILFGIPTKKDGMAGEAFDPDAPLQKAISAIKSNTGELLVITDVCLCEYMDHGHCGIIIDGRVDNDSTLELLAKEALSHVKAGADVVAPSDMMDGRVSYIRKALDMEGFFDTPIISYAVKYASAYYGPFREAADSAPKFGDRKSYQMDPANRREALKEALQDVEEGADMIMVKPALAYLDIIRDVRNATNLPVVAYNVSGEYSMIMAAVKMGYINMDDIINETLLSIKRAGSDLIISYFAKRIAETL
jgi:porphobilinogen synthase